jgi:hypothetical protein
VASLVTEGAIELDVLAVLVSEGVIQPDNLAVGSQPTIQGRAMFVGRHPCKSGLWELMVRGGGFVGEEYGPLVGLRETFFHSTQIFQL